MPFLYAIILFEVLRPHIANEYYRKDGDKMIAEFKVSHIDYKNIAGLILNSNAEGNELKPFILLLIKSTDLLTQSFKNKVAVSLCNKNKEMLIKEINHFLEDNHIKATVVGLQTKHENEHVLIQAKIIQVDYEKIVLHYLPDIISLIPNDENTEVFLRALQLLENEREQMISAMLSSMSEAKKDEILKLFVNAYRDELCIAINELLADNDIVVTVDELKIC